jgi:renalase
VRRPHRLRASCLVVGAGISGLLAAQRLSTMSHDVTVVEEAARPGGRLATARQPDPEGGLAVWDVGAQFFTARDEAFRRIVSTWVAAGTTTEWFRGLPPPDPPADGGEPHYCGTAGMDSVAAHAAAGLRVRCGVRIDRIESSARGWSVLASAGQRFEADALVLAVPVVRAIPLLEPLPTSSDLRDDLGPIDYEPTLVVLARLEQPSALPGPGAWHGDGQPLAWVGDNQRKGISPVPAVTIHAGPDFSRGHLEQPDELWAPALLREATELLGAGVRWWTTRRWDHATPTPIHPNRTVVLDPGPPLALAGDAFAGPRVEGAALSGLAAADAVVSRLGAA